MIAFVATLDSQIFQAYQLLKKARLEGDYVGIVRWMCRVDELLDRRAAVRDGAVNRSRQATPQPN